MNDPRRLQSSRRSQRPLCPVHGLPMNVNRTLGELQYRYCPVPDCRESKRTLRRRDDGLLPAQGPRNPPSPLAAEGPG